MRLIDADELKMCYMGKNSLGTNGNDSKADYASIRKMIDAQPTAYDVEKVVKQLEDERQSALAMAYDSEYFSGQLSLLNRIIPLVKGAVKDE